MRSKQSDLVMDRQNKNFYDENIVMESEDQEEDIENESF